MIYFKKIFFATLILVLFVLPKQVFADQVSCGVDLQINPVGSYTVQADWYASVVGLSIYDIYLDTGSGLYIVGKFNPLVWDDGQSGIEWVTFSTPGAKTFHIKSGPGCDNYYTIDIPDNSSTPLGTICVASNIYTSWVLYGPKHSIPYSGTSICIDDDAGDWTIGDMPIIAGFDGPYLSPSNSTQKVQDGESISWNIDYVPITTIVNGSCGSAATSYSSSATGFSGSMCSSGNAFPASPSFPSPGSTVGWNCLGSGGGSDDSCLASRADYAKIDGICGTANRLYMYGESSYGSDSFCTAGVLTPASTPAFPVPGGSNSWACGGQYGGLDISCSASRESNIVYVNVSVNNIAGGNVTSSPGGINCGTSCSSSFTKDSLVVLTELPASSYWKFDTWGGDCAFFSRNKTCILNLNSAKNVTAKFVPRIFDYYEF